MEQYAIDNIRNMVMLSHSGAGKTALSEAMLFNTGAISRLGRIDEGTTTSDYDPDEIRRKISLNLSLLPCAWKKTKLNIIDTPGYADFVGEVKSGMRVSEGAVVVISAASGIEVGTEQVWKYCEEEGLPRFIYINKMDRENVDFQRVVDDIKAKFGARCIPIQMAIGTHTSFQGIVDLMAMKTHTGSPGQEGEIPAALKAQAESLHSSLVETIAGNDEVLIEKFLNDQQITPQELDNALRAGVAKGEIVPILTGSAMQNIGVNALMEAISNYLPSPKSGSVLVLDASGKTVKQEPAPDGPLAALVFKTSADPYVGKLTFFRIYNGSISSNSQVWNATRNEPERVGQLFIMRGKNQEATAKVGAGDIGVVAKLNVTATGDTLCERDKPVKLAPIVFPEPVFSGAVSPKTKADLDKLGSSLNRIVEEDPTLRVRREHDTAETILSGLGDTHLEVAVDRMSRKFGVGVDLKTPKVPYKETITKHSKGEHRHKKQTGGHGQYGHAMLEFEPLPRGTGNEFVDRVVGGSIPRNYIPAVEKGVNDGVQEGVLAGYPIVDVRAIVYDGSFHPVDSSEICFKIAGAQAVKRGMEAGNPVLLEPIVNIKITVPETYTGDIMSDLNNKRARVMGMTPEGGNNVIEAQAPLAEVLRYNVSLKSITQGRGTYTYTFSRYEEVPTHITQKICAERAAEKEREKAEKS